MKPFFTYYGGKWRSAPRYPKPAHRRVVEPFAGSAGYATRHHQRDVVLVDLDETVAALWRWLIAVPASEVLALPLLEPEQVVGDLDVRPEAAALIGFWCNKSSESPRPAPGAWMRSGLYPAQFWGREIRQRVAEQVDSIRHWTVIHGDYREASDFGESTWFVDPPYEVAGSRYRYGSRDLDFKRLGAWCHERRGRVIVCEAEGATWLQPNAGFASQGLRRVSREVFFFADQPEAA